MRIFLLILIIITLLFLFKRFYKIIPGTTIYIEEIPIISKVNIPEKENETVRLFNVFNKDNFEKINEAFTHKHTDWENFSFNCETELFENFDCFFYKIFPFEEFVPKNTLFYFPQNDVTWNEENFLYDEENDHYYFLKPNSLLLSKNSLKWYGKKNINIIIGNKRNCF